MSHIKQLLPWFVGILLVFAIYVWNFGLWPQYFDIAWDEEVQLHDGRVIVVHMKRTYQRIGLRLERYPQITYFKSMEFSFDTGFPTGKFTHVFNKPGDINFIDFLNDKWYIGYNTDSADNASEFGITNLYPHVVIICRDGSLIKPNSWEDIPSIITNVNVMPPTPNVIGISKFNNSVLTVDEKMRHWEKYPTGAGEHTITRITAAPIQKEMK
jgi:hypothetical protein